MNRENIINFTPPDQVLCIYLGNCADGFGAAWVVHRFFGEVATFHAGHYGQPPPDCTGKVVFIVDFSYPRDVLIAMAEQAQCIVVLDHHKTGAENLHGTLADNIAVVFDMEHSGAALTWHYFYPDQHAPPLLKHIEDRDLWRFALPHTREIQAALFSYPYDFAVWNALMLESYDSTERLQHDGIAIERKHHKDIAELLAVTRRTMTIGGIDVPTANLPYTMSSEAGHIMATDAPFAACYWDTPDGRVFSLRSRDDGADVSAIAAQYGGGGHQHAAGFRVPYGHELAPVAATEQHVCRTSMLREMNEDLLAILGKPNFACAKFAHLMKAAGVLEIPPKAEVEQAHVLLWLLRHYLDHGRAWDEFADRDVKHWLELREALRTKPVDVGGA